MIDPNGLLMIEPSSMVSEKPVIDDLTRRMTEAWRGRRRIDSSNGRHQCACGTQSDDSDWEVGATQSGLTTNSLCIHYLAHHRPEVPALELAKVATLPMSDAEPTEKELCPPSRFRAKRLGMVPDDLRTWLGSVIIEPPSADGYKGTFTALDAFLLDGRVTMFLNPADLPVSEAELVGYFQRLHCVWYKPFGDAFGGEHHILVTISPEAAKLKVRIEIWGGPIKL